MRCKNKMQEMGWRRRRNVEGGKPGRRRATASIHVQIAAAAVPPLACAHPLSLSPLSRFLSLSTTATLSCLLLAGFLSLPTGFGCGVVTEPRS